MEKLFPTSDRIANPRTKLGALLALVLSSSSLSCSVPDCSAAQADSGRAESGSRVEQSDKQALVGETRRKVQWVVDGDTFKICPKAVDHCDRDEQMSVRVKGLECPESSEQACSRKPEKDCATRIPIGKRAKAAAIKTLKDQTVTLVPTEAGGQYEKDPHGRLLAYVNMPNSSDFGLGMIQKGLCYDFGFRYPHAREDQYRAAQQRAGVFPLKPRKK